MPGDIDGDPENPNAQEARHGVFPERPRGEPSDFWDFSGPGASAVMFRGVPKKGRRKLGPARFFGAFQDIAIWDFRTPSRHRRAWLQAGSPRPDSHIHDISNEDRRGLKKWQRSRGAEKDGVNLPSTDLDVSNY
jgi:hypothetical protein